MAWAHKQWQVLQWVQAAVWLQAMARDQGCVQGAWPGHAGSGMPNRGMETAPCMQRLQVAVWLRAMARNQGCVRAHGMGMQAGAGQKACLLASPLGVISCGWLMASRSFHAKKCTRCLAQCYFRCWPGHSTTGHLHKRRGTGQNAETAEKRCVVLGRKCMARASQGIETPGRALPARWHTVRGGLAAAFIY